MIIWQQQTKQQRQQRLERAKLTQSADLSATVAAIIEQVKTGGDSALVQLTEQFDGVKLNTLTISAQQISAARNALSTRRYRAIAQAYQNIKTFHQAQQLEDIMVTTSPGVLCQLRSEPLASIGLYIPAGSAPLPSTVLMLGVPAQIAGCQRIALVCPPNQQGQLADEVLVAASLCGISEIYCIGGAQAIAALALGTKTIAPVTKVFGPGNRFITEAKKQLAQQIPGFAIDMPAGPSELLIIADEQANPAFIAADLLSQAEHGADSQVILVTNCAKLIEQVQAQLTVQLAKLSRQAIATQALQQSRLILAESIEQAIEISNQYAPEHLIVNCQQARALLPSLRNAGSIFLGAYTPESAGDYASGTNHVLPTYGYAKVISSLSLADFSRRYTVQEISKAGLQTLAECIIELTNAEGLDAHQNAVTIRLSCDDEQSDSQQGDQEAPAPLKQNTELELVQQLARPDIQAMVPYQSARRLEQGAGDVNRKIWLNANEASGPGIYQISGDSINRYPDFQPSNLLKAYSDYCGLTPANILATRGADEGIELIMRSFCTAYQDSIIICPPTYGMYQISAENHGVGVLSVPLVDSQLNVPAIVEQLPNAKLIFLCSPGNPTGNLLPLKQIKQVLAASKQRTMVVVDEAYIEFCPEQSVLALLADYPNLIILRTLSKAFALAGLRCGFCLASAAVINLLSKVIAPYPIPTPVAELASKALSREGLLSMAFRVTETNYLRQQLSLWLQAQPWCGKCFASDANFILFECQHKDQVVNALRQNGIFIRDQSHQPLLANCLRISIGSEQELKLFKQVLSESQNLAASSENAFISAQGR
jgi:histidinol-phosphate aminotransferase